MAWIAPIKMNMDISLNVLEGHWEHEWIATAQKVAIITVAPFALIAMTEAIVKNMILINLMNVAITLLNVTHYACFGN
jgi:hypothetical protein